MQPRLDYLNGYTVTKHEVNDDGTFLHFGDGTFIRSTNFKTDPADQDLEGLSVLTTVINDQSTRVLFGISTPGQILNQVWVEFPHGDYEMTDVRFPQTEADEEGPMELPHPMAAMLEPGAPYDLPDDLALDAPERERGTLSPAQQSAVENSTDTADYAEENVSDRKTTTGTKKGTSTKKGQK